jgi:hypothetical protein
MQETFYFNIPKNTDEMKRFSCSQRVDSSYDVGIAMKFPSKKGISSILSMSSKV